jgi:hypothetical protein
MGGDRRKTCEADISTVKVKFHERQIIESKIWSLPVDSQQCPCVVLRIDDISTVLGRSCDDPRI